MFVGVGCHCCQCFYIDQVRYALLTPYIYASDSTLNCQCHRTGHCQDRCHATVAIQILLFRMYSELYAICFVASKITINIASYIVIEMIFRHIL